MNQRSTYSNLIMHIEKTNSQCITINNLFIIYKVEKNIRGNIAAPKKCNGNLPDNKPEMEVCEHSH